MTSLLVARDRRCWFHLENIPHLESARRMDAVDVVLGDASVAGYWVPVELREATDADLTRIHTPAHIARVAQSEGRQLTSFDFDTQASTRSFLAAKAAVGSVFSLLDGIMSGRGRRGFAFVRPPGHHAEPDRAMGFCLFNNVALGARYLQDTYGMRRVMIVDIDAHHGNGIQSAFYGTDTVLYLSLHQFPTYPGTGNLGEVGRGTGEGYTVNVPLPMGMDDRIFAQVILHLADPLAREYRPEMLLVACGFDLYTHDPLAKMRATPAGYALITRLLLETAATVCDGRIAFVMEGGYSLKGIRECGLRVVQELCGRSSISDRQVEKANGFPPSRFSTLKKVMEVQKKYWKTLR